MISVSEAEAVVLKHVRAYGSEQVELGSAVNRVLAEPILADRDMPPYSRATMDGIALRFADFAAGQREFKIVGVQAAGEAPTDKLGPNCCIQIMTGAAVPDTTDTVVPVEDIVIKKNVALVSTTNVIKDQFIHPRGLDKSAGSIVLAAGQLLTPAAVPVAATMGKQVVLVSRLPRIVVISTGNELVDISAKPTNYQIRRSNDYAVRAALAGYGASIDMLHVSDSLPELRRQLKRCLDSYDAVIISGGVSKGAFDYVPEVLAGLAVNVLFHGVRQKPGKPFWFGARPAGPVVFALPGNPVSTYLCVYKYVLPWLRGCLGLSPRQDTHAVLAEDVHFQSDLHYFVQVMLGTDKTGRLLAAPIPHNGSSDFIGLVQADAFIELPPGKKVFKKGEAYQLLDIRHIV